MGIFTPPGVTNPGTEYDFTLFQNNDEILNFSMVNGPVPFVLTGYTVTFYLKANSAQSDNAGFSNNPTITSSTLGQFTVTIPRTQLTVPTLASAPLFYHVDAAISGTVTTLVFGNIAVIAI